MGHGEKEAAMDDQEIVRRIGQLADEERALEHSHAGEGPSADELSRLRSLEVATSLGHGSIRDLSRDDLVIRDDFEVVSSTSSPRRRPT